MARANVGPLPTYSYIVPQIYSTSRVRLVGLGAYTPKGIITNDFFAFISTQLGNPKKGEDLERVTGLETRHVRTSTLNLCRQVAGDDAPGLIYHPEASQDESLLDMALIAARRALASAGRDASEIDTVIAASSSDNEAFPTIAGLVQLHLGCRPIRTATLKGACACQSEAFQMAAELLMGSTAKLALIVTAEALLSNIMHILDWRTSSLFGEGAVAFLIERDDEAELSYCITGTDAHQGPSLCYQTPLRKDAIAMAEVDMKIQQLYRERRGAEVNQMLSQYMVGYAKMNGKEVYREGPRAMAESVDVLCRHAQLDPEMLTHIVPHQANSRLIRRMGELLIHDYGWPESTMEKIADHFRFYGNLSNASIGIALVEMLHHGKLQKGDWLALTAVGGGMQYGCWLVKYDGLAHPEAVIHPRA